MNGAGGDPDGKREVEDSFLVCGIDKDTAIWLGKKYEQNAILYREGKDVELVLVGLLL
jgi:hypothetical protein